MVTAAPDTTGARLWIPGPLRRPEATSAVATKKLEKPDLVSRGRQKIFEPVGSPWPPLRPSALPLGLVLRPAQSVLQLFLFLFPSRVLGLRFLFEGVAFALDRRHPLVVLPFGLIEGCLSLVDGPLAALAFLLPDGLFPPALDFAPLLLFLECERGLAFRIGISPSRWMPV